MSIRSTIWQFFLSLALTFGAWLHGYAQAPVFSQYYASSLYLNPALCGLEKDIYLGMNYRSQWSNINLPFNTFQFSFIHPLSKPGVRVKHLGGLGASFLNDAAGPNDEFVTQSFSVSGAYNLHMSRYGNNILSMGLQAGVTQQRVNFDALEWSSQYNPIGGYDDSRAGEAANLNSQVIQPQVTFGVMWYYTTRGRMSTRNTSIYNGLSIANLIPPPGFVEDTQGTASVLYKLHGGFVSMRKLKYEISPNYLVQYQNNSFQVNVGTYVSYFLEPPRLHHSKSKKVTLGTWYRLKDAFIFSTGFSNTTWNVGFSYDTNVSSMGRNLGAANAYEISLAYKIVVNKGFKRFSSPLI
jgi:type IX secretion system PorP/SprF family membrane protein